MVQSLISPLVMDTSSLIIISFKQCKVLFFIRINIWNDLPTGVAEDNTIDMFKNRFDKYLSSYI